ncbi:MAG: oprP [Verrucomicrobiales bacterium]|nr:oprP [Verrucomicrobiales bacterium]
MNIHKVWLGAAVVQLSLGSVFAQSQGSSDDINTLKKQIQELDQKVRILERNREVEGEAVQSKKADSPKLSAGADGFGFSSADTNFVLKLHGAVQVDGRFYQGDHIPVNDTFLLRRVRPTFEGTLFQHYDYRIMLDFGAGNTAATGNNSLVQDAYLNIHYWPEFQIQLGKFKTPVGLERLQSDVDYTFTERGYPTQLVPNRDVGVQIHGELFDGILGYQAGIFNGVQDGGSGDQDISDDHKDVAGRIFLRPFKNVNVEPLRGLGFGVAGTYGNQAGPLRGFTTPGQQNFFGYRTGSGNASTNVTADGLHWRLVPQAYYYWGPLGIFGEYALSSQQIRRDTAPAAGTTRLNVDNTAWEVTVSYILTGEENSWKGIRPRNPLSFASHTWGALEVVGRVEELKLDAGLFPLYATSSSARRAFSYGAGLNWYLNKSIKLSADYEHTDFSGGSKARGNVTAQDEHVILTRAQVSF